MPNWKKLITSGSDASLNSLIVTAGVTGSLLGTASYATQALSSSYALSASHALTASFITASNVYGPYGSNSVISASYAVTSSYAIYAETASSATNAQDILIRVLNQSGNPITKGLVVHITASGTSSDIPRIITASYENDNNSANTLGITNETIANGAEGFVMTEGVLKGIDTSAFVSGQLIYLGATGSIIGYAPLAPLHNVRLGQVIREQSNNGSIYVRIDNGYEIEELHDVLITSASSGDLLIRSASIWINSKQLTGSYAITGSLTVSGSSTFTNIGPAIFSGSVTSTGGFTGSLLGTATTASYVTLAQTASYVQTAQTASYVLQAVSASFASTASSVNTLNQIVRVGSDIELNDQIGAINANSFNAGLGNIFIDGLASSIDLNASTIVIDGSTGDITATNFIGDLTGTASYATQALSASYAPSTPAFPYTGSAEITGSLGVTGSFSTQTYDGANYVEAIVINDNKRTINDTLGTGSFDADQRNLQDSSNNTSINWDSRRLIDSSAVPAVRWDLRSAHDTVDSQSINWGSRLLKIDNGPGAFTVNWGSGILRDTGSTNSVDWQNRQLKDSSGNETLNWQSGVKITGSLTVSGSSTFTNIGPAIFSGSVISTAGFTGSLQGTAATASYVQTAQTASYVLQAVSASFASTASYYGGGVTKITAGSNISISPLIGVGDVTINATTASTFPYTGSAIISGSLESTGSFRIQGAGNGFTGPFTAIEVDDANGSRKLFDADQGSSSIDFGNRALLASDSSAVLSWSNINGTYTANKYTSHYIEPTVQADLVAYQGTGGQILSEVTFDVSVVDYDLVYLDTTNVWKQVDQTTTSTTKLLGICVGVNPGNQIGDVFIEGDIVVTTNTGYPIVESADYGIPVYIKESSLATMSTVEPTTGTVRKLGFCYYNNGGTEWIMKFRPNN